MTEHVYKTKRVGHTVMVWCTCGAQRSFFATSAGRAAKRVRVYKREHELANGVPREQQS